MSLPLAGCRPEPIGAYLKALGVLRLVAEQVDTTVTGWWVGDTFRLDSPLDEDGLASFFLERYRPTPVLSPWNNDSGFKESGSTATTTLLAVETSDDPRFESYREAIAVVRQVRDQPGWDDRSKAEQVALLRNHLPDDALHWLDAAIVLRPEKPAFPALLGAGGNFGRLELSPSFMARLSQVLDPSPKARALSLAWLRSSLFAVGSPALRADAIGQFEPGAAGGVRADAVGGGKAMTNPWDLVLIIEGSLLWASGVSRRLGGATSIASIPFTVAPSPVGHSSLSPGETAKAEVWAPLWDDPLGLPALRRLFAEGRLSWSSRQARTGLDAARAVCTLGADAGVTGFVRHLIADRMGQSPLAVPVGRFSVPDGPRSGVAVLGSLDRWADRLRRAANVKAAPASLVRAAHQVDLAIYQASSGRSEDLQDVLSAVARAEALCGRSERGRTDGVVPPVPWLNAAQWLPVLDDGSSELRLAAAIAVARDDEVSEVSGRVGIVRSLLRPIVTVAGRKNRYAHVEWARPEAPVRGFGSRPVANVLADVLVERSEAQRLTPDAEGTGLRGAAPWFPAMISPLSGDVEEMAGGITDLARLEDLLTGMLLLGPEPRFASTLRWAHAVDRRAAVVPAWRILAPFFSRNEISTAVGSIRFRPEQGWARRLASGDVASVLQAALVRWEQGGIRTTYDLRSVPALAAQVDGPLLAATLLCGATRTDVRRAVAAVRDLEPEPSSQGEPS